MPTQVYSIDEIREIVAPIAKQHGVDKVFLFGSYARGDATPASDVDLCVDAPKLRGLFALGGLYADLEDALKKSIDVVTTGSLKYNKDEAFLENLRKDRVLLYELS
jgi:predicted nucleotidyltransferase